MNERQKAKVIELIKGLQLDAKKSNLIYKFIEELVVIINETVASKKPAEIDIKVNEHSSVEVNSTE